jgi:hypothetical protein
MEGKINLHGHHLCVATFFRLKLLVLLKKKKKKEKKKQEIKIGIFMY